MAYSGRGRAPSAPTLKCTLLNGRFLKRVQFTTSFPRSPYTLVRDEGTPTCLRPAGGYSGSWSDRSQPCASAYRTMSVRLRSCSFSVACAL